MIIINIGTFVGNALCIFMMAFLFLGIIGLTGHVLTVWVELFKLARGKPVDPKRKFRGGPMKRIPPLFIDKCDKYCDLCGCVIPDPDNIHVSPYCLNCLRGA